VWHESEDFSGFVAQSGDICERSIGIFGFREETDVGWITGGGCQLCGAGGPVAQRDLLILAELLEQFRLANGDATFGVCDGDVEFIDISQKRAVAGGDFESDPAIGVASVTVPCECHFGFEAADLGRFDTATHEQSSFENGLEAVADSQHQFISGEEPSDGVIQLATELPGKDDAGAEVIAVAETAGDAENLEFGQSGRVFQQSIEVQPFGLCSGEFKSPGCFDVAVRAWCAEDADFGGSHEICRRKSETVRSGCCSRFGGGLHPETLVFRGAPSEGSGQWESIALLAFAA